MPRLGKVPKGLEDLAMEIYGKSWNTHTYIYYINEVPPGNLVN